MKRDTVFANIALFFPRIPLELHLHVKKASMLLFPSQPVL